MFCMIFKNDAQRMRKKLGICLHLLLFLLLSCGLSRDHNKIDRYELVTRHNIQNSVIDPLNSLSVGNGEFAYTADITGMQTFPEYYESGIPLGTQSQWGWHSFPNPENYTLEDVLTYFPAGKDSIPYPFQYTHSNDERKNKATEWLRENPHRLHLGLIGLQILKNDSTLISITDIQQPDQQLNLWSGELKSHFQIDGIDVEIITVCHQELDMVSFHIRSALLATGRLNICIRFPYATHEKFSPAYDLSHPGKYTTQIIHRSANSAQFKSQLDQDSHYVGINWKSEATVRETEEHIYMLTPINGDPDFELACHFTKEPYIKSLPSFSETSENSKRHWQQFWQSGGAVDFSLCTDPRAAELEKRVVLSQYLTKIQCSGSLPPQETGLTYNSWYGKFHLEMHWWHAIHFILWGRPELVEQQLSYYSDIMSRAQQTARLQGYQGVRWPKMTGPDGRESPSTIGPFLIWQQPHIMCFAELLYEYYGHNASVLEKYRTLVFATADFMASYARWDSINDRYILGPPIIPAQECFNKETTVNPSFELEYWLWGLQTAQKWRERSGFKPDTHWQQVIEKLSVLPVKDSLYLFTEDATDLYSNPEYMTDHPMVLGISGFLPASERVDRKIMQKTLMNIKDNWNWESAWGWDFPMAAMNAVSLNLPESALEFLLMDTPKNRYLINGHNYQDSTLTLYLPGNGALLTAIAMMCTHKNGFPKNGRWKVKYENIHCLYNCD